MLHQIGHSLGLAHYHGNHISAQKHAYLISNHNKHQKILSIMDNKVPFWKLSKRDISVIQNIYGKPGSKNKNLAIFRHSK
jgi:hypothetical protein